jgi:hypothetical protein
MAISGISTIEKDGYTLCFINEFTDTLKKTMREELRSICHGKKELAFGLQCFSYENTVKEFFERYNKKTSKTQKGMLGELVAHLLVNKVHKDLTTITILFNKEEISVRKGFDLTYVEKSNKSIWYGEVKSGELGKIKKPDVKNKNLLSAAKKSLRTYLSEGRQYLWRSVIYDVGLNIDEKDSLTVKQLLDTDWARAQKTNGGNNVVLISVLFHNTKEKISEDSMKIYLEKLKSKNQFSKVVLFSIQKSTYKQIEEFLRSEMKNRKELK